MLIELLKREGVEVIFGYPGGAVLDIYDALMDDKDITHILVRHEQGAAHAADGYARTTGKVGVCIATSGPGASWSSMCQATTTQGSSHIALLASNVWHVRISYLRTAATTPELRFATLWREQDFALLGSSLVAMQ